MVDKNFLLVNFVSTQFLLSRNIDVSYIFYEKEVSLSYWLDMPWIGITDLR